MAKKKSTRKRETASVESTDDLMGGFLDRDRERRRPRIFELRGIVRQMALEYLDRNPNATPEEAIADVKDNVRDEFGDSPWLEILMKLVEQLLPLLLKLLA